MFLPQEEVWKELSTNQKSKTANLVYSETCKIWKCWKHLGNLRDKVKVYILLDRHGYFTAWPFMAALVLTNAGCFKQNPVCIRAIEPIYQRTCTAVRFYCLHLCLVFMALSLTAHNKTERVEHECVTMIKSCVLSMCHILTQRFISEFFVIVFFASTYPASTVKGLFLPRTQWHSMDVLQLEQSAFIMDNKRRKYNVFTDSKYS